MNEIFVQLLIEGKHKKGLLTGFTSNSLTFNVEGEIMYMNRNMFRTWQLHPEIDLKLGKVTLRNGVECTFLN